jgi:thioredoxin reductase
MSVPTPSEPDVYDVIIVGFGPAGAAAANAAGARGLRTLVVERDLAIFDRPIATSTPRPQTPATSARRCSRHPSRPADSDA